MLDYQLTHINTGCYYDSKGQEITIINDVDIHGKSYTHFIDHSRMLDGSFHGRLSVKAVIVGYLKGFHRRIMIPYTEVQAIEKSRKTYSFIDWSSDYKALNL